MREPYTFKKIVVELVTAPFDPEIYTEFWSGLKQLMYAVLAFVCRIALLSAFPLSLPALFFILQLPENKQVPWWYTLTGAVVAYIVAITCVLFMYTH